MTFDLETYLNHIGLGAAPAVSPAGLELLQTAQMRAIPFETIDPFLGRIPDLAPEALWQKLIGGGRGGYCFELNGLFAQALAALGFSARPMLARVRMGAASGGPRSHHCFAVTLDGRDYLADCGFGGPGPVGIVELGTEREQEIAGSRYRIVVDPTTGEEVLERYGSAGWLSLYGFDHAPVAPPDYLVANFVCARWEQSQFPTTLMLTRPTATGRLSMRNRDLRIIDAAGEHHQPVESEAALSDVLRGPFGLALNDAVIAAVWAKLDRQTGAASI